MITRRLALACTLALLLLSACGGGEEEESANLPGDGTYSGTITAVNAAEREIYVEFPGARVFGLYFTDSTEVTGLGGATVPFDSLAREQSVEVTIEREGEDLNPLAVTINQQAQQTNE